MVCPKRVAKGRALMVIDYEKEEQQFMEELKDGKFAIEVLENEGSNRGQKEAEDVVAFDSYLNSNDFKSFREEVKRI
jgi:hypothetical protein